MNSTHATKKSEQKYNWHFINADNKVLGRLSAGICVLLTGKNKVNYVPYLNMGDKVVVYNSKKIAVTGTKELHKMYYSHSGTVGNLRTKNLGQVREHNSKRIILDSITGMLPKNRLRNDRLANLYIYEDDKHPHSAQMKGATNE